MKLVFGLGNPGEKFVRTRHNTGFMVIDAFANQQAATFTDKPKFQAHLCKVTIGGESVLLVKPQTFYNEAGQCYRSLIDFYTIDPADTLMIHDELALPFGTVRSRIGGSDAGNNGIKSINQHGGETSARLRVGIGNERRAIMGDTDFVLGTFDTGEQKDFDTILMPKLLECINEFTNGNHLHTSFTLIDKTSDNAV